MMDVEKQIEEVIASALENWTIDDGTVYQFEQAVKAVARSIIGSTLLSSAQSGEPKHATQACNLESAQGMDAHGIAQKIKSLPRYSVGKDEKGAMHTFTMQDGPFLRVHEVLAAIDAAQPAAQGVEQDAARWRMITLIEREVMMHPDKRSSPEAVGAYMKTVREGFNFEAAIDAALAAQAKQGE